MIHWLHTSTGGLLTLAGVSIALLLLMIIRFKMEPFIALIVVGLLTVLVFSLGFASVLVLVGVVVGHVGQLTLSWFTPVMLAWLEVATGLVIVVVGGAMTIGAWRQLV